MNTLFDNLGKYLNDTTGTVFVDGEGLLWSDPSEDRYVVDNRFGFWVNFDLTTGEIVFANIWAPLIICDCIGNQGEKHDNYTIVNDKKVPYNDLKCADMPEKIDIRKIIGKTRKQFPLQYMIETIQHIIKDDQRN